MSIRNAFLRATALAGLGFALTSATASAQVSDDVVKIAIVNDQSSILSEAGGYGVVVAAQMAIEDFGSTVLGKKIELVYADHQNKPDIGVSIVRKWLDTEKVDVIVDGGSSAVGMAIQPVTRERNKLFLISGSGTQALTNENCSPVGFQWSWDTYGLASGTPAELVKQGLDSWFFITADYTFGHLLEKQASDALKAAGGKVVGSVRHPFNTGDFSSFLVQARASGAKVVALANAGGDAITAIKQAHEFGLTTRGQSLTSLLLNITDVHAIGLDMAKGLVLTTSFYWDMDEQSRAFGKRFIDKAKKAPTFLQAGAYSAVMHYLKAVQAAGTDATDPVAAKMRETRINDPMTRNGWIREDGRVMRDYYIAKVKAPDQVKTPWAYYDIIGTVAAEKAAAPLSESKCALVKK